MKLTSNRIGKLHRGFIRAILVLLVVSLVPIKTPAFTWGVNVNDTITRTLVVSGVTTPITSMSLIFTGFHTSRPADQDMLLVAPGGGGQNLEFMSDAGGNVDSGTINFTISDTGATFLPNGAPIVTGTTYKPGDYGGAETFPGFAGTVNHAQTNGVATFTTAFGATSGLANANGNWTLIIVDDATAGGEVINSITKVQLVINGVTAADSNISGIVTDDSGTPVSGAVVNLSGAQSRKTISDSKGFYQFDNVETSGFYTVTPSRANYSFSPSSRSFSQLGNHTDAAFTGSSSGDNANPLDTAEYFVRQQYVDILGREPDEGGFNYWSNEILSCGGDSSCTDRRRREVAASFFIAEEFQDTGSFIYDMYKGSLGRKPVFNEYSADRKQVVGGSTLTAQKAAFADNFVNRTEFVQKYQGETTAESFVDAILQNVQQSSQLDMGAQRAGLINQYNSGGTLAQSRSLVLRSLADNAALKQKEYNAAFVLTEYFGYLRRNPEPEGYDFWLNVVTNGDVGNYRGMVCSFITSTEYQQRFSSVVSHSNAECGQ
jgi:Carboxypeptidase regulatory-like domain/Domain of unknown function (DUF4214)